LNCNLRHYSVARSGTNREGGFTEAQLSKFVEEGRIDKPVRQRIVSALLLIIFSS